MTWNNLISKMYDQGMNLFWDKTCLQGLIRRFLTLCNLPTQMPFPNNFHIHQPHCMTFLMDQCMKSTIPMLV